MKQGRLRVAIIISLIKKYMNGVKNIGQDEISKTPLDSFNVLKCSPGAFTGGTTGSRGDDGGAKDPLTLFKVTGQVLLRIFGVVTVDLVSAGGGTVEVGVAGNTASLIAQEVATELDAGGIYLSATQVSKVVALSSLPGPFIVNNADIIETVGTADITAGNIDYICLWRPLSPDGNVEVAL